MDGDLITLPLRLGVEVTRAAARTATGIAGRALALVGSLAGSPPEAEHRPEPGSEPGPAIVDAPRAEPPVRPPQPPPAPHPPAQPPAPAVSAPPVPSRPVIPEPESEHVSEEPELVAEVADPGAEDGAGPEITVEPPWEGYDALRAQEIVDRLSVANAAELAVVRLYETTHRRRETVLAAVERELAGGTREQSR